MNLLSVLLQAQAGGGMGPMLPMIILLIGFLVWQIISQRKEQKKVGQFRANLKPGDSVILPSGIYGKIKSVEADNVTVRLEIAPNVVINVNINYVHPTNEGATNTTK